MSAALDHLVVAAATLDEGVAWCEATLGVAPPGGGRHDFMGTHNRLLRLSAPPRWPDAYLEIIAIDPDGPAPARPRWFGLDEPALQRTLRRDGPRLLHAVVRTGMLQMHRWGLTALGLKPGEPLAAGRDTPQGRLQWNILVAGDGRLDARGALPTLIEWQLPPGVPHPAAALPDSGVALQSLALAGLPAATLDVLRLRGVQRDDGPGAPPLRAVLATPRGPVELAGGWPDAAPT